MENTLITSYGVAEWTNEIYLRDHPCTDLIEDRIRLTPGTKPYAVRSQKRYSHYQEMVSAEAHSGRDGRRYL